jgi:hypothetical protein
MLQFPSCGASKAQGDSNSISTDDGAHSNKEADEKKSQDKTNTDLTPLESEPSAFEQVGSEDGEVEVLSYRAEYGERNKAVVDPYEELTELRYKSYGPRPFPTDEAQIAAFSATSEGYIEEKKVLANEFDNVKGKLWALDPSGYIRRLYCQQEELAMLRKVLRQKHEKKIASCSEEGNARQSVMRALAASEHGPILPLTEFEERRYMIKEDKSDYPSYGLTSAVHGVVSADLKNEYMLLNAETEMVELKLNYFDPALEVYHTREQHKELQRLMAMLHIAHCRNEHRKRKAAWALTD